MSHIITKQAAGLTLSIIYIISVLLKPLIFSLEPYLFSEAAGLAFVKGAGQWNIWQVTTPWVGGGHMAGAENVLVNNRTNSSSSIHHSNSTMMVTSYQL